MEDQMQGIITAMDSAFKLVQDNAMSMISAAVPYALGIMGTVLAITIGIGVFKKLTSKAS